MSYTIYLVNDKGERQGPRESICPTFNLSTMFYKAMGVDMGSLEGKKACDVLRPIRLGLHRLRTDPEYYDRFNARNGWGIREDAIDALEQMQNMCVDGIDFLLNVY